MANMIITFMLIFKITLIEFRTRFLKVKKWRMLQSYRYINHVEKQNPPLLIAKNRNTNSKGAKSNLIHWLTWYIRRYIMERLIFKIKIRKEFQQVMYKMNFNGFGAIINFNGNNTIPCIASIYKIFTLQLPALLRKWFIHSC